VLTVSGNFAFSLGLIANFFRLEWSLAMLVLSRKLQQQIVIPELNIRITVLSVGTNRVQLGIEAPNSIQITRPEVNGLRFANGVTSEWRQVVEV